MTRRAHIVVGTRRCYICGREISRWGAAWVSHGRAHVRRGEATADLEPYTGRWIFRRTPEWYGFPVTDPDLDAPVTVDIYRAPDMTFANWHEFAAYKGEWPQPLMR